MNLLVLDRNHAFNKHGLEKPLGDIGLQDFKTSFRTLKLVSFVLVIGRDSVLVWKDSAFAKAPYVIKKKFLARTLLNIHRWTEGKTHMMHLSKISDEI